MPETKQSSAASPEANGFLPHLFLFPLPVRPVRGESVFQRSTLRTDLRLSAQPDFGVPHGADRMIFLLLATYARMQGSRQVDLGPASRILAFFGLEPDGRNYERLAQRFARVLGSTFEFTFRPDAPNETPRTRSVVLCEESRLWFQQRTSGLRGFANTATLSEQFWAEISRSTVTVPLEPYRALLDSPGNLDLYLWLLAQSQLVKPGRHVKVPVTGEGSLAVRLGSKCYAQDRDFRRKSRLWLRRVLELWRGCPAVFSSDGTHILVSHSSIGGNGTKP